MMVQKFMRPSLPCWLLHAMVHRLSVLRPIKSQSDVINHLTGETLAGSRNVLIESARIARGAVQKSGPRHQQNDLDALIVPGGFGAAKNLSNFASRAANAWSTAR